MIHQNPQSTGATLPIALSLKSATKVSVFVFLLLKSKNIHICIFEKYKDEKRVTHIPICKTEN